MRVPSPEHARLVKRLPSSQDEVAEIEGGWAEEARKRLEAYRSVGLAAVSGAEVFADARARSRRRDQ